MRCRKQAGRVSGARTARLICVMAIFCFTVSSSLRVGAAVPIERQTELFSLIQRWLGRNYHFTDNQQAHGFLTSSKRKFWCCAFGEEGCICTGKTQEEFIK